MEEMDKDKRGPRFDPVESFIFFIIRELKHKQ